MVETRNHVDAGVRAQDDLFRHVNRKWLDVTEIPEDRSQEGSFTALRDASELAVRSIIESADSGSSDSGDVAAADGGDSAKIGVLYAAFMDTGHIAAQGLAPLDGMLARIDGVTSPEDLVRLSAEFTRSGVQGVCAPYVSNDAGGPSRYLLHVYQSGLGMPDESYYREPQFAETRGKYSALLERLFELAGQADPGRAAARVLELETALAASHMSTVDRRDPQKTYNLHTFDDAAVLAPFIAPWLSVVTDEASQAAEVVVCQPDYLVGVENALSTVPLPAWKDWLRSRVLLSAADYLDEAFVNALFAFYGTHLAGTPRLKERWKRGVAVVEGALGEAVGRQYVARHFPESHKDQMLGLVANLIEAYSRSISSLAWMGEETRDRALLKLSQFTTKIGYPDQWIDYTPLDIVDGDLFGNVCRAGEFEHQRQLNRLGGPIDRGAWLMTPQTVNAYYMPTMNEIVFPAAILQAPFFEADADPAVNYGAIGAVIGHEIGHGFDDKGSQFDGHGALSNWWSDGDRSAFDALTSRLVDQYAVLAPAEAPTQCVNGELTLGENIGDLGGLSISYLAYLISLDGAEAPVIDGQTGAQRFFSSWASCWRQKIRPEEAARRLTVDPHSPNEFRCNQVVRNLDEFHDAFGTTPEDGLWLAPEQRVRIW
ncbi:M13-type metalloendopeptidase [Arthrobacter sp. Br18]|uniref:M13 family metallopeptidase n=1 Tax=Arthrobacter sp. Br18 TaxID=1312954 RepID=UPI00047A8F58|nr:M13-type metalloendopeptidase [Arthrobacter sp. Br18]